MTKVLLRIGDKYCEWDRIMGKPTTYLMSLRSLKKYIDKNKGKNQGKALQRRFDNLEVTGTSCKNINADRIINKNSAGPNGETLTGPEIRTLYDKNLIPSRILEEFNPIDMETDLKLKYNVIKVMGPYVPLIGKDLIDAIVKETGMSRESAISALQWGRVPNLWGIKVRKASQKYRGIPHGIPEFGMLPGTYGGNSFENYRDQFINLYLWFKRLEGY